MKVIKHGNYILRDLKMTMKVESPRTRNFFSSQYIMTSVDFFNYEKGNILKIPRYLIGDQAKS